MEPPNAAPECYLDRLPEHLLAKILSMGNWKDWQDPPLNLARYCKLRTVCKLFHKAISQVERVGFHLDQSRLQEMKLVRFLEESEKVRFLCIAGGAGHVMVSNTFLALVLRVAKALTSLQIEYISLGRAENAAEEFVRTLSSSSSLQSLTLNYFHDLSIKGQLHSKYPLKNLKSLVIEEAVISEEGLASLLKLCPSLTSLTLAQIKGLERACIKSSILQSFHWIEDDIRFLEKLDVDAPRLTSLVMPRAVEAIIIAPALEQLEVTSLGQLTGMQFSNVKELRVIGSYPWTGADFLRLLRACRSAAVVELDAVVWAQETPEGPFEHVPLAEILTSIQTVRKLVLKESGSFSVTADSRLPLLESLEELELAFSSEEEVFPICSLIAKRSPYLRKLIIDLEIVYDKPDLRKPMADVLELQRQHPSVKVQVKL